MTRTLSASQARRIALAAQGFRDARPNGRVDRRHLRRAMGRLGLLQLDSVPVVMRTQYMPLFARLGPYDPDLLDRVAYRDDEWFETWCHEASLMPTVDEPLMRWHKTRCSAGQTWGGLVRFAEEHASYVDDVLAQVRERPRAPGELDDPRPNDGDWWGSRSDGSTALDWLFRIGDVGIRRRPGFVKEFDLMERIVPDDIRAKPTPTEEDAHRTLLLRAAASLGVAAVPDLVDYHRLPKKPAKLRAEELIEDGALERVDVEGWNRPAYLHPDAVLPRSIDACTLLSPFDPVVWYRERGERLFNFDYRIEIYTPAAKRVYGYYVLPFLLGDDIVGRLDGKTDRSAGVFRVFGAFAEPGVDIGPTAGRLADALDELATFVGVDGWQVDGDKGDLIDPLRRTGRGRNGSSRP
ncbi:MAG: crosslink repair DNA glycosylase YcaQ family protein [Actinomycetota bacterium]